MMRPSPVSSIEFVWYGSKKPAGCTSRQDAVVSDTGMCWLVSHWNTTTGVPPGVAGGCSSSKTWLTQLSAAP